jgi:hypothetical protein
MTIRKGTLVQVGRAHNIPLRYQGRTAEVLGATKTARGAKAFSLSFGDRRVEPLTVSARFVTPLA